MKHLVYAICSLSFLMFTHCGPALSSTIVNPQQKLSAATPVALLDVHHELPQNVLRVGDLRFQDSGFSTDCSFNSLMQRAKIEARKNGANIVKVIDKKSPNVWSSCYRLKIELYRSEGDVTSLAQYTPSLD